MSRKLSVRDNGLVGPFHVTTDQYKRSCHGDSKEAIQEAFENEVYLFPGLISRLLETGMFIYSAVVICQARVPL